MQIKCPECGFDRKVDESRIPSGSSFATCPKCGTRFRFRAEPEPQAAPPEAGERPGREPKEGDIWASMDKMRREWDKIDREERRQPPDDAGAPTEPHNGSQDDGQKREEAMRAYRQAAAQVGKVPFLSTEGSVPWEYRGGFLNPVAFIRTVILMVTRLPQFFSGINPYSSIFPAWVFLLVVRGVQMGAAIMNVRLIRTLPDGSQEILSISDVSYVPMLIFISICMITLMHFAGSFIVNYTIQAHSRSAANFRLTFKVMAYANMPVVLSIIPGVGSLAGLFASLTMLLFGIRHAYGFSWRNAVISILPYLVLSVLFLMMLLQAAAGSAPA